MSTPQPLAQPHPGREAGRAGAGEVGVALGAVATLSLLAWLYLAHMAGMHSDDAALHAARLAEIARPALYMWGAADVAYAFAMWSVMMLAMMAPAALPMLLAFSRLDGRRRTRAQRAARRASLVAGYLAMWLPFSAAAALLQWTLHAAGGLAPGGMHATPLLGGGLLALAGVYQFTPLKQRCLTACRDTAGFLMTSWREGAAGAFVMGARHGGWCVGCCWATMLVLFAAGIMNLLWVALIAGYVLLEKVVPAGAWLSRTAGAAAVLWGVLLMAG